MDFKSGAFELGLAWAHCPQDGDKEATQGRPGCVGGPTYDDSPGRKGGSIAWYWGPQVDGGAILMDVCSGLSEVQTPVAQRPKEADEIYNALLVQEGKAEASSERFLVLPPSFF